MKCHQCPTPAFCTVANDLPLCLACYQKWFQIQQIELENCERGMDYAMQEMDWMMGSRLNPPRYPERKIINLGSVVLHNIKIDNSTIGAINTGTIGTLDVAITSVKQSNKEAAEALTKLSEAVLKNPTQPEANKTEILEILSLLASELTMNKEQRRPSMVKTMLARIKELLSISQDLTTLWEKWGPILTAAFG